MKYRKYQDVTVKLTPETTIYPGDPTLTIDSVCHINEKNCFGLSKLTMSNHFGTHIDFPSHVIPGGKTSSDYNINDLIGNGIIIEIPIDAKSITKNHINSQKIEKNSFIFFKTANSNISKQGELFKNYVYIEPEAAMELLNYKVKVVGIDYLSVDSIENHLLPVHHILLENDVLIIENLELSGIAPGQCIVHISPLNIPEMDGLPARVVLER